jgi:putative endonuclease
MLGLDPSISCRRFSGLHFASPENDVNLEPSFVYLMTNKPRGTLYLGVTGDLVRRVGEHKQRAGRSFTAHYNLDKLVWFEQFDHIDLAIQRETSLKRWLRAWKIELVEKANPGWRDLFEDIYPPSFSDEAQWSSENLGRE